MTSKASEQRRVRLELMETAVEMSQYGLLSKSDLAAVKGLCDIPPEYTASRVTTIRIKHAKMSQSVFASLLNVSVSTVQKWESPNSGKRPNGAAAKLLQLLERKGVQALLV